MNRWTDGQRKGRLGHLGFWKDLATPGASWASENKIGNAGPGACYHP